VAFTLAPTFPKGATLPPSHGNRFIQRLTVPRWGDRSEPDDATIHRAAEQGVATPSRDLPFADRIQAAFGGHDLSDVQAHLGSEATVSAHSMGAAAFTMGNHVVFAGTPDLRTTAHEAAHVVQQRSGVQLAGGIGRAGDAYECQADAVAARVAGGGQLPLLDLMVERTDPPTPRRAGSGSPPIQMTDLDERNKQQEKYAVETRNILRRNDLNKRRLINSEVTEQKNQGELEKIEEEEKQEEPIGQEEAVEQEHAERAKDVNERIDQAVEDTAKDEGGTIELEGKLNVIKDKFELKSIEFRDLGTPEAAVWFEINPWYTHLLKPGKVLWQMSGKNTTPTTRVFWKSKNLTIGAKTANVGRRMIADPLASDHQAGSGTGDDSDQDGLMSELVNSGSTSVPDPDKYVKGHLLNDNVGGPGRSYNLFPITKDANAKHHDFVEKYVKAQVKGRAVIYYEVAIENITTGNAKGKSYVDSDLRYYWCLLDTSGKMFKKEREDTIKSHYGSAINPAGLFDVTKKEPTEYVLAKHPKQMPTAVIDAKQETDTHISSDKTKKITTSPILKNIVFPKSRIT